MLASIEIQRWKQLKRVSVWFKSVTSLINKLRQVKYLPSFIQEVTGRASFSSQSFLYAMMPPRCCWNSVGHTFPEVGKIVVLEHFGQDSQNLFTRLYLKKTIQERE